MKRFERKMASLAQTLEQAATKAEQTAALEGAERARRLAPVDSGKLRNGIRADGVAVISTAPHAAMVEFGTTRSAAQPYMQPMAEEMRREFADMVRSAAKEVLG